MEEEVDRMEEVMKEEEEVDDVLKHEEVEELLEQIELLLSFNRTKISFGSLISSWCGLWLRWWRSKW